MSRPPASVVILAWNAWEATQACLASLRPTLGDADQVVVVNNGSTDETAEQLAQMDWLHVLTNDQNRGFAKGCNQGAQAAVNDFLVFLNNDTMVSAGWLEGLLQPFEDGFVVATGPRSNAVSGAQLLSSENYAVRLGSSSAAADLADFAWHVRLERAGHRRETRRLVGFCLAVRRSAFRAVGGWDERYEIGGCEDDDLCARLLSHGGRLLIVDDVFVHHHGHVTFSANGVDWYAVQRENFRRLHLAHDLAEPRRPWPAPLPRNPRTVDRPSPRVTVAVATSGRPTLLRRALQSLARQTFRPFEVVVVNDGGCDVSPIVTDFASSLDVHLLTRSHSSGPAAARNEALRAARGELFLILDDDDVAYPHLLSSLVTAHDELHDDLGAQVIVHGQAIRVVETSGQDVVARSVVGADHVDLALLLATNTLPAMTVLAPTEDICRLGGFDEQVAILEDWELWLRLGRELPFHLVPVPVAEYRVRPDSLSVAWSRLLVRQTLSVWEQHPVSEALPVHSLREQILERLTGGERLEVTMLVVCSRDQDVARRALQAAMPQVKGTSWELLLAVPDLAPCRELLDQLGDAVKVRVVGDVEFADAVRRAAPWAAGERLVTVDATSEMAMQ
jgi:GT2 family glycosyltransferase